LGIGQKKKQEQQKNNPCAQVSFFPRTPFHHGKDPSMVQNLFEIPGKKSTEETGFYFTMNLPSKQAISWRLQNGGPDRLR
jgi:hypothetical protein